MIINEPSDGGAAHYRFFNFLLLLLLLLLAELERLEVVRGGEVTVRSKPSSTVFSTGEWSAEALGLLLAEDAGDLQYTEREQHHKDTEEEQHTKICCVIKVHRILNGAKLGWYLLTFYSYRWRRVYSTDDHLTTTPHYFSNLHYHLLWRGGFYQKSDLREAELRAEFVLELRLVGVEDGDGRDRLAWKKQQKVTETCLCCCKSFIF